MTRVSHQHRFRYRLEDVTGTTSGPRFNVRVTDSSIDATGHVRQLGAYGPGPTAWEGFVLLRPGPAVGPFKTRREAIEAVLALLRDGAHP